MDFAIEAEAGRGSGVSIVKVRGEVDIATAPQLEERVMEVLSSCHDCIIDCAELDYLDSTGFHTLLYCRQEAQERGSKMALAGLKPNVERVFRITKMAEVFTIFETLESAEESLAHA